MMRYAAGVAMVCLAVSVVLLSPRPAFASQSVLWQGTPGRPFQLAQPLSPDAAVSPNAESVGLKVGESWSIDASTAGYASLGVSQPDPQSVQVLAGGDVLVADPANHLVAEFSPSGSLVWSYTVADDSALSAPVFARRLADGSTLICDGDAARVFVVTPRDQVDHGGQKIWQYGVTGVAGSGVGQLDGPTSADILPNGNVAICDAGNHRVIVVRYADYKTGFSASSIVWQYGQTGVSGDGVDQLMKPTSVQVLTAGVSRGNMLICDQGARRVIEVRTTAISIVWRYPASGSSTDSALVSPSCAVGTFYGSDNLVWIADAGRGVVLGVATNSTMSGRPSGHQVFAEYGPSGGTPFSGSLSAPASMVQASDGAWWWPTPAVKGSWTSALSQPPRWCSRSISTAAWRNASGSWASAAPSGLSRRPNSPSPTASTTGPCTPWRRSPRPVRRWV